MSTPQQKKTRKKQKSAALTQDEILAIPEVRDAARNAWDILAICLAMFVICMLGAVICAALEHNIFANIYLVLALICGTMGAITAFIWRWYMGDLPVLPPEDNRLLNGACRRKAALKARFSEFWNNLRGAIAGGILKEFVIVVGVVLGTALALLLGITAVAYGLYLIT